MLVIEVYKIILWVEVINEKIIGVRLIDIKYYQMLNEIFFYENLRCIRCNDIMGIIEILI